MTDETRKLFADVGEAQILDTVRFLRETRPLMDAIRFAEDQAKTHDCYSRASREFWRAVARVLHKVPKTRTNIVIHSMAGETTLIDIVHVKPNGIEDYFTVLVNRSEISTDFATGRRSFNGWLAI